jgi:hypothetical protein
MVRGRCVLTQQIEGYKRSRTGRVELDKFRFEFGIRTNTDPPHIVDRQTVRL